jgi:hypothetical protein
MKGHTFKPTEYDIFCGLDVDKRSLSVNFTNHQGFLRSLRMPYNVDHLVTYVRKNFCWSEDSLCLRGWTDGLRLV